MEGAISLAATIGLSNLQNEPQRLQAEAENINQALELLVLQNYNVFVDNLTCSSRLREEDSKIDDALHTIVGRLQSLSQQSTSFRDLVHPQMQLIKRNRNTLTHHMQLVELLEVPQLVDACARNNFHDEAVDLAQFVNSLERRHLLMIDNNNNNNNNSDNNSNVTVSSGGSKVIQSIVDEVQRTLKALQTQLLEELTDNTTLSRELHILSILRKLDSLIIDRKLSFERFENPQYALLTEEEREANRKYLIKLFETKLQMSFLEARGLWIQKQLTNLEQGIVLSANGINHLTLLGNATGSNNNNNNNGEQVIGPYGKTIELLELYRTNWFAVMTQFAALFQDNPAACLESVSSTELLHSWIMQQIHHLLHELQLQLPLITEGRALRTVMEQALLLALRMGEMGCDFSVLLLSLFENVLMERIQVELAMSVSQFKSMVLTERFSVEMDDNFKDQVVPLFAMHHLDTTEQDLLATTTTTTTTNQTANSDDNLKYISELMLFTPLAYLCNDLMEIINFLRECPLKAASTTMLQLFGECVQQVTHFLVAESVKIRHQGAKYLPHSNSHNNTNNNNNNGKGKATSKDPWQSLKDRDYVSLNTSIVSTTTTTTTTIHVDQLYANAFVKVLVPHVLTCVDQILSQTSFPSPTTSTAATTTTTKTGKTTKQKLQPLRIRTYASEVEGKLSASSFLVLKQAWELMEDAHLITPFCFAVPVAVVAAPSSVPSPISVPTTTGEKTEGQTTDQENGTIATAAAAPLTRTSEDADDQEQEKE